MDYLVFLISALLIGSCACRPTDSEYAEFVLDAPNISSLQDDESAEWSGPVDDYVVSKRELIVSKDNSPVNLTHQQTFLLADIITRIESSIVHSAFDIVSVFKINKQNDGNITEVLPQSTPSPNEPVTLFSESMLTTIPATHDMPAHVSIDKVTVYEANSGNIPFLPAFQIVSEMQNEKQKNETEDKKIVKRSIITTAGPASSTTVESKVSESMPQPSTPTVDAKSEKGVSSTITASIQKDSSPLLKTSPMPLELAKTSTSPATPTANQVSTHDLPISRSSTSSTTESGKSTTTPKTTTRSSTSSTTESGKSTTPKTTTKKSPVKELQEQEEEAKEKIAEIEAEPVILSSRV